MRFKTGLLSLLVLVLGCSSNMSVRYLADGTPEVTGGQSPYTFQATEWSTVDVDANTGTMVEKSKKVENVVLGLRHTCAIDKSAELWCWGNNRYGQTGTAPSGMVLRPVKAGVSSRKYTMVALTDSGTCATTTTNELYCWGYINSWHTVKLEENSWKESRIYGMPGTIQQLTGGFNHMCAMLDSGAVYCWGSNVFGSVTGTLSGAETYTSPVKVEGLEPVNTVVAGQHRTCASGDALYCWGLDLAVGPSYTQSFSIDDLNKAAGFWSDLGYSDPEVSSDAFRSALEQYAVLQKYTLPVKADYIVLGSFQTCVASADVAYCKGVNNFQSSSSVAYSTELVEVKVPVKFKRLTGSGSVLCYGGEITVCSGNLKHLVPEGTVTSLDTLHQFPDMNWKVLEINSWLVVQSRICGIDTDDDLYCWGSSQDTVAGDGGKEANVQPVKIRLADPVQVDKEKYSITVTDRNGRKVTITAN